MTEKKKGTNDDKKKVEGTKRKDKAKEKVQEKRAVEKEKEGVTRSKKRRMMVWESRERYQKRKLVKKKN